MENENEKLQAVIEKLMESFNEEQKAKAAECEDLDDLIKFASGEGIEIPEELLDDVAGGRLTFLSLKNGLFGGFGGLGIKPLFQNQKATGVKTIFNAGTDTTANSAVFNPANKTTAVDTVFHTGTTGNKNVAVPTGIIVGDMQKA